MWVYEPGSIPSSPCNMLLEMNKGKHVCSRSSQHIIAPEYYLHLESVVPDHTLDKLQAGAICKFLVSYRVPRNCKGPAALMRRGEFLHYIRIPGPPQRVYPGA